MNYKKILDEVYKEVLPYLDKGKVANYIPALANVNPKQFAMSLTLINGKTYNIGDIDTKFSIQSISKVFAFTKALDIYGEKLYKRVGKEPSGNAFNSLVQLEYENGIPRNPFINAGAIVVTDALMNYCDNSDKSIDDVLEFIHNLLGDNSVTYNKRIWKSEYKNRHRNSAMASLMKSFGNLNCETRDVLKNYFKNCSIMMNTKELSRSILFLANQGIDPITNKVFITSSQAKRINALMLTCGHYDASGDFAFYVGLPGKSGVGGGIVAVIPNVMSIAVFSPGLNSWGNSLVGTKALELFTTKTGLSIF